MIIYFSGTNNSEYVAKKLANSGETVIDIFAFKDKQITANRLGIVAPVHCYSIPKAVEDFIKNTTISAPYIFAVLTCGGTVGKSINHIQYWLQQNNNSLSYGNSIVMPDNCVILHNKKTTDELYAVEDINIGNIKKDLQVSKTMDILPLFPYNRAYKISWFALKKIFNIGNKKATKKCNKCGICVKSCPTKNIALEQKIIFKDNCVDCFRCINICPKQAIKFGRLRAPKHKQYMHR